ncbi:transposase [Deinococcus hopiensis]|uniref:transposase n=1 Tax=Deinococcus hopiensis TaxID=309885 RepID=UPI003CCBD8F2
MINTPRKKSGRPRPDARSVFSGLIPWPEPGSPWSQLPRRNSPKSTVYGRLCAWGEVSARRGPPSSKRTTRSWAPIGNGASRRRAHGQSPSGEKGV